MDRFAHFQVHGCASARLLLRQLKARLALLPAPDPAALARELRWLIEADLRGLARELGVPTLLVSGVHDPLVPRAASEALCASLKNATHVSLEACGHAPFLAHPELVARHIKAHLCAGQAA
jgi:pimeloyl-[acyl-carrier protein] methyl ester esterase